MHWGGGGGDCVSLCAYLCVCVCVCVCAHARARAPVHVYVSDAFSMFLNLVCTWIYQVHGHITELQAPS